jgi:hypothetical protein
LKIEPRVVPATTVGEQARLAFRLTFADTGKPDTEAKDVLILMAGPSWQRRQVATHAGNGVYYADFTVPVPGAYTVLLSSSSRGLAYAQYATVNVNGQPN